MSARRVEHLLDAILTKDLERVTHLVTPILHPLIVDGTFRELTKCDTKILLGNTFYNSTPEILDVLLSTPINFHHIDGGYALDLLWGKSVLSEEEYAKMRSFLEVLKKHHIHIDDPILTCTTVSSLLELSLVRGTPRYVSTLIEYGADVLATNEYGMGLREQHACKMLSRPVEVRDSRILDLLPPMEVTLAFPLESVMGRVSVPIRGFAACAHDFFLGGDRRITLCHGCKHLINISSIEVRLQSLVKSPIFIPRKTPPTKVCEIRDTYSFGEDGPKEEHFKVQSYTDLIPLRCMLLSPTSEIACIVNDLPESVPGTYYIVDIEVGIGMRKTRTDLLVPGDLSSDGLFFVNFLRIR